MEDHDTKEALAAWVACVLEQAPTMAGRHVAHLESLATSLLGGRGEQIDSVRELMREWASDASGVSSEFRSGLWCLFMERALADTESKDAMAAMRGADLVMACRLAQGEGVVGLCTTLAAEGASAALVADASGLIEGW